MQGKLILVIGPSGSGKTTLIEYLRELDPTIEFPVSCTTRSPRSGEKEGDIYHFVSVNEFQSIIQQNKFLEWANYGGNLYGTLKSEVLPKLNEGKFLIRQIDVQGAIQIRNVLSKDELAIIFIDAGSWENLKKRIETRAPIASIELKKRQSRFNDEMEFSSKADMVVQNKDGEIEHAKTNFIEAVYKLLK